MTLLVVAVVIVIIKVMELVTLTVVTVINRGCYMGGADDTLPLSFRRKSWKRFTSKTLKKCPLGQRYRVLLHLPELRLLGPFSKISGFFLKHW